MNPHLVMYQTSLRALQEADRRTAAHSRPGLHTTGAGTRHGPTMATPRTARPSCFPQYAACLDAAKSNCPHAYACLANWPESPKPICYNAPDFCPTHKSNRCSFAATCITAQDSADRPRDFLDHCCHAADRISFKKSSSLEALPTSE